MRKKKRPGLTDADRHETTVGAARHRRLYPTPTALAVDVAAIALACSGEAADADPHSWPAAMPPCERCGFPGHVVADCVVPK